VLICTLGTMVRITPDDTLSADEQRVLEKAWSRTVVTRAADDPAVLTVGLSSRGSTADVVGDALDALMTRLTQRVTLTAIERRRGELLMLHAAGLADPSTGRTLALVAPSKTGKTTAARTLARELGYVSDETVGVTADHRVVAHPKPLSIRPEAPDAPPESRQVSPDELGLLTAPDDLSMAALAVLDRDPAALAAQATPLSLTEVLELVVPQVSYLPELPEGLTRLLDLVTHCGGGWRLTYAEAADLAPLVHRLLEDSAPVPSPWRAAAPDRPGTSPRPGTVSVRRLPSLDAVTDGTSTVVLKGRQVVELQGIAPVIWDETAGWATLAGLTGAVVEAFGSPPGSSADSLVRDAVQRLVSQGLLETRWAPRSSLLSAVDLRSDS
jgi:hypothetical protein